MAGTAPRLVHRESQRPLQEVCAVRKVGGSEARVAGQRSERHFHVLLHDDVKAAHQRPEGEEHGETSTKVSRGL